LHPFSRFVVPEFRHHSLYIETALPNRCTDLWWQEGSVDMLVFLFTDIEGSTRLWEEHTGVMTGVIARHDEILRSVVRDQGGRLTTHTGDGIAAAQELDGQARRSWHVLRC